ncbi:MAG: dTDP-4-dehydrorhamnose 3,5-epimerase [Candidatus Adiutrix sp.]|jgi:dTDP-4-dehydrorhamnose 3,5-epimerase|nr:dTDP-4-dehydrorhamnose 3,5-epimerase [Candidatus Adiutrix sp.]
MRVESLEGLMVLTPRVFEDERGCFWESYNQKRFAETVGREVVFVQDNQSVSRRHVLRGLHFQVGQPQAKLVWVSSGVIFDVTVDLRPESPTFGHWAGLELSGVNRRQLWVPEGLAHGFLTLSERAEVSYKVNAPYAPDCERTLCWDDPTVGVAWPLPPGTGPILSAKDRQGLSWGHRPQTT